MGLLLVDGKLAIGLDGLVTDTRDCQAACCGFSDPQCYFLCNDVKYSVDALSKINLEATFDLIQRMAAYTWDTGGADPGVTGCNCDYDLDLATIGGGTCETCRATFLHHLLALDLELDFVECIGNGGGSGTFEDPYANITLVYEKTMDIGFGCTIDPTLTNPDGCDRTAIMESASVTRNTTVRFELYTFSGVASWSIFTTFNDSPPANSCNCDLLFNFITCGLGDEPIDTEATWFMNVPGTWPCSILTEGLVAETEEYCNDPSGVLPGCTNGSPPVDCGGPIIDAGGCNWDGQRFVVSFTPSGIILA